MTARARLVASAAVLFAIGTAVSTAGIPTSGAMSGCVGAGTRAGEGERLGGAAEAPGTA